MSACSESGTLPRPGSIGRVVRLLSAILIGYFALQIWHGLAWVVQTGRAHDIDVTNVLMTIGVVIYLVPHSALIVGRSWPRARLITIGALAILAGWSLTTTGLVLGVPLILPTFLVALVLMALLSISFFLAAILAVPG